MTSRRYIISFTSDLTRAERLFDFLLPSHQLSLTHDTKRTSNFVTSYLTHLILLSCLCVYFDKLHILEFRISNEVEEFSSLCTTSLAKWGVICADCFVSKHSYKPCDHPGRTGPGFSFSSKKRRTIPLQGGGLFFLQPEVVCLSVTCVWSSKSSVCICPLLSVASLSSECVKPAAEEAKHSNPPGLRLPSLYGWDTHIRYWSVHKHPSIPSLSIIP